MNDSSKPTSTQRDELAVLIAKHHDRFFGVEYAEPATQDYGLADELVAAGWTKPRTIATAEELDALPMGSKVVSAGYEWTKNYATVGSPSGGIEREVWFNVYDDFDASADVNLPATVLWEPAPEPTKLAGPGYEAHPGHDHQDCCK